MVNNDSFVSCYPDCLKAPKRPVDKSYRQCVSDVFKGKPIIILSYLVPGLEQEVCFSEKKFEPLQF